MGWKKIFEIRVWKIILSIVLILLPWVISFFVGTCNELNPPQCTNAFTEFFLYNRSFQFALVGIAFLSSIWLVIAIIGLIVGKLKKK